MWLREPRSHSATGPHRTPPTITQPKRHPTGSPTLSPQHTQLRSPRFQPAPTRKIEEALGLAVQVISDPLTGTPLVLPLPRGTAATTPAGVAG